MEIPEKYQEFGREVAKLAIKLNAGSVNIKVAPHYKDGWEGDIEVHWNAGRHGDEANRLVVVSTVRVLTDLS